MAAKNIKEGSAVMLANEFENNLRRSSVQFSAHLKAEVASPAMLQQRVRLGGFLGTQLVCSGSLRKASQIIPTI
jgi:hypothetical protein